VESKAAANTRFGVMVAERKSNEHLECYFSFIRAEGTLLNIRFNLELFVINLASVVSGRFSNSTTTPSRKRWLLLFF